MLSHAELANLIERTVAQRRQGHDVSVQEGADGLVVEERKDGRQLWALHIGRQTLGLVGARTDLALEIVGLVGDAMDGEPES